MRGGWNLGKEDKPKEKIRTITIKKEKRTFKVGKITTTLHMKNGNIVIGPDIFGYLWYDNAITTAEKSFKETTNTWFSSEVSVTGQNRTVRSNEIESVDFVSDPDYTIEHEVEVKTETIE